MLPPLSLDVFSSLFSHPAILFKCILYFHYPSPEFCCQTCKKYFQCQSFGDFQIADCRPNYTYVCTGSPQRNISYDGLRSSLGNTTRRCCWDHRQSWEGTWGALFHLAVNPELLSFNKQKNWGRHGERGDFPWPPASLSQSKTPDTQLGPLDLTPCPEPCNNNQTAARISGFGFWSRFCERDSGFEWSLPSLSSPEPVKAKWFSPAGHLGSGTWLEREVAVGSVPRFQGAL